MLSIIICDDEPVLARNLADMVTSILARQPVQVQTFADRGALDHALQNGLTPDIALLDIRLQEDSGIQLARALFPEGSRTQVIFVTGFPDYHTDAYEAEHIYFLLKPVEEASLRKALQKAQRRLKQMDPGDLTLVSRTRTTRIPFAEIYHIESVGRKVAICLRDRRSEHYCTLSSLEKQLPDRFVRCHKSFFVNLDYVERMETGQFILKNGSEIPISQMKRNSTRQRFLEYLGKKL